MSRQVIRWNKTPTYTKKKKKAKKSYPKFSNKDKKQFTDKLNNKNFPSELWFLGFLKKYQITGFKRNPYIKAVGCYPDFYWEQKRTVVEIDGGYHQSDAQQAKDERRDNRYRTAGIKVLRINYMDVARAEEVCSILVERYKL